MQSLMYPIQLHFSVNLKDSSQANIFPNLLLQTQSCHGFSLSFPCMNEGKPQARCVLIILQTKEVATFLGLGLRYTQVTFLVTYTISNVKSLKGWSGGL